MCLAIPGKIIEIKKDKAVVSYGKEKREADISVLKGIKKGDYVVVNSGFVIEKIETARAEKFLRTVKNARR